MTHTAIHPVDNPTPPSTLTTAVHVAQQMLGAYGSSSRDGFDYAEAYGALRESLRILLRAVEAGENA